MSEHIDTPLANPSSTITSQPSTNILSSPLTTRDATALAKLDSAPPAANASSVPVTNQRKLRRNGRIARLPKAERDMVNRMLWNNVPYKDIVRALDEMAYTVTERNISNWATGGYLEWRVQQEAVLQHRLDQDHLVDFLRREDAGELPEVGLQAAATRLSQVLLHQLATAENPQQHIDEYSKIVDLLARLNREINASQKIRDEARKTLGPQYDPARVKEENEIAILEDEADFTRRANSNDPQASVPFLKPLPMSTVHARDAAAEAAERRKRFEENQLALMTKMARSHQDEKTGPSPKG